SQSRTDIPAYARVDYPDTYAGIDLAYYSHGQELEYDFVVAPGANPDTIALGFTGADSVTVDAQGDLVLQTAAGAVREQKPFVYQEVNGVRQEIPGSYVLHGQQVGFQVGAYDTSRPLVIDPVVQFAPLFFDPTHTRDIGNA